MKKKLLLLILPAFMAVSSINAQTKVWDFGNDATTWPTTAAGVGTIGANTSSIIDMLGLFSNGPESENQIVNFGAVNSNNSSFPDGYTATRRFQMNGGGGAAAGTFLPVQRYLFFDVTGSCTVKVWFRPGSNGAQRTIFVTNGTASSGSATSNTGDFTDFTIVTANYSGPAARLYIYGDTACNLFKIEVTGATVNTGTMSSDAFQQNNVNVFGNGQMMHIFNVTSSTEVNVYSLTGALVKSFTTSSDVNLQLNQGFYIVKLRSQEGDKTVKVILN
jgi:hypothetical protein